MTKREYEQIAEGGSAAESTGGSRGRSRRRCDRIQYSGISAQQPDDPSGRVTALTNQGDVCRARRSGACGTPLRGDSIKGYAVYGAAEHGVSDSGKTEPFSVLKTAEGLSITTPFANVDMAADGSFYKPFDLTAGRQVLKENEAGNRLRVYEDKPIYHDNWDIDVFYTEKYWDLDEPASVEVTSVGPLCLQITVKRSFMHSA